MVTARAAAKRGDLRGTHGCTDNQYHKNYGRYQEQNSEMIYFFNFMRHNRVLCSEEVREEELFIRTK